MQSIHVFSRMRRVAVLAAVLGSVATAGCVYRPTIQQGNLLQLDEIEQVKVGMTRSQVRYILGTPMVSDPFQPDRWDYVYTLQVGHEKRMDRAHFVVLFEGDKVSKVEKRAAPEESAIALRVKEERAKKAAAESKAAPAATAPGGEAPAAPAAPAAPPPGSTTTTSEPPGAATTPPPPPEG